jgi:putative tryptophan/tyrosine transport system substrate-binding protein
MRRREFIAAFGGAAVWPLATRAQQPAMPVIGFLNSASNAGYAEFAAAFHHGLAETGFVEGRNVAVEYRWADGAYDRLPALAAEMTRLQPTVIFANNPAALHVKAATTTIPIVFTAGFDPIELGLVTNLKQPGGNITGVSILNVELVPKRLAFLHELIPRADIMALLVNPANPNVPSQTREVQAGAQKLGLRLHVLRASTDGQLTDIFEKLRELRSSALLIGTDPFFTTRSRQLAALALHHAMPAIYQYREFVAAGGLMSYGANLADAYRLAGSYVGRILKGDKPADLPVQQSTKIELIFNLKTAKALGLNVPESLLARADEVIE